ncbi:MULTISPECIES: hypothetical protein [Nocardiopsis]|uniref:hypothetical protein n=1 Tax=Nocardiopsis TaxID=2013 RepID=UPI00117D9363|nr:MULTISPECIES: hypothetical protein [Nocardiopsis]
MEIQRRKLWITNGTSPETVYESDLPKQVIIKECAICRKVKSLQLSHIAPKWSYKWAKNEGHVLSEIRSKGIQGRTNDGSKHYLLCKKCEQCLGESENYLSKICKGNPVQLSKLGISIEPGLVLSGLRRDSIIHAISGILYKAHYAASDPWRKIRLPEPWLDTIRSYLLHEDASLSSRVAVLNTRWISRIYPKINPKAIIVPQFYSFGGIFCFQMLLGGWSWFLFFPEDHYSQKTSEEIATEVGKDGRGISSFLREELPMQVIQGDIIWHVFLGIEESGPLAKLYDNSSCPCGLGKEFAKCCKDAWININ